MARKPHPPKANERPLGWDSGARRRRRRLGVPTCLHAVCSTGASERLLQLAPAFDRDHDRTHPVALSEHELLNVARLELGEQRPEVAHRLTDRAELVRADPDGRWFGGHRATQHRRLRGRNMLERRRIVDVPSGSCASVPKLMPLETPELDPGRFKSFAYLATPNAWLYRRVMLAFVAAKRRFVVHLRSEDVLDELALDGPADPKAVIDALSQLVEWGNLRADPDTSRVTSVEDFHRARFLYQLSHAGEAAERSLAVFDEQLGRRGALQAVALEDIATGLGALRELTQEAEPDVGRAGLLMRDLVRRCVDLAENAQAFMGSLQRTIDLYELDIEAFRAYKDRLIEYLERFIKDLTGIGGEVAELLGRLDPDGIDRLLTLIARRDAEDAAPGPAPAEDFREQAFAAELASWTERWIGLQQWFISSPEHPSQAKLLRARARKAIPDLLAVVALLNERRAGRSDRTADFRELAVWFAQAPDEPAMHRLWQATFGLHSSRHLTLDADNAQAREKDPVSPSTPWHQAPPLMISPRLRRTGSYERRGKPNRVIDRRAERRLLAERAAAEAAADGHGSCPSRHRGPDPPERSRSS